MLYLSCWIFCVIIFLLYSLCCTFCVIYFLVVFFRVISFHFLLKAFNYLQHLLLLYDWQILVQIQRKTVSVRVDQLGLIHYLVICLCLFWNNLSERNLNCLLLFLPLFLIFVLHKWYSPIIFSNAFCFHHHYIITLISPSFLIFIPHHLFCLKRINRQDGVDESASEIGNTTYCNGYLVCNSTRFFLCFEAEHL